jgi:hypothetical protein
MYSLYCSMELLRSVYISNFTMGSAIPCWRLLSAHVKHPCTNHPLSQVHLLHQERESSLHVTNTAYSGLQEHRIIVYTATGQKAKPKVHLSTESIKPVHLLPAIQHCYIVSLLSSTQPVRLLSTLSMHSCTNQATLPTSSHGIKSLKLDVGRPAK